MQFFYQEDLLNGALFLADEEYQHCIKVLRNEVGSKIGILDGRGNQAEVEIFAISKNQCDFRILSQQVFKPKSFTTHLGIAPTKNMDRIEWLVEKACELGVDEITFFFSKHSERGKMRLDRIKKKTISALKQSKSGFLTRINGPLPLKELYGIPANQKFIAAVQPDLPYLSTVLHPQKSILILIGPEGDFSKEEVNLSVEQGFQPVSLGSNVLRTETAGLMACHFVNVANGY